jgi:hypothetical protein
VISDLTWVSHSPIYVHFLFLTLRGLYLARVNPYGIHVESMESIRNSMWNPWNQCWLKPQPICCSMDIMDSMWNDHGMDMEWLIPHGFHMDSTDSTWNLGMSTLDSMDKSRLIPWNNSIWIPWNKALFPWETPWSKIMLPFRFEHSTWWNNHMGT